MESENYGTDNSNRTADITFKYNINTKLNISIIVIQKLRLPIPRL